MFVTIVVQSIYKSTCPPDAEPSGYAYKVRSSGLADFSRLRNNRTDIDVRANTNEATMKIFLSSTYIDLIEHRKAVANALRTMDEEVGNMEIFGARDEEATKVSLEELDKCDVLV